MEEKIRVIVKRPYENAVVTEIKKGLKPLQNLVEGLIDCTSLPGIEGVDVVVNDEGMFLCEPNILLPEYKSALFGTLVVAGFNDEGDHISLTNEQIFQVMEYLNRNSIKSKSELMRIVQSDFAEYQQ